MTAVCVGMALGDGVEVSTATATEDWAAKDWATAVCVGMALSDGVEASTATTCEMGVRVAMVGAVARGVPVAHRGAAARRVPVGGMGAAARGVPAWSGIEGCACTVDDSDTLLASMFNVPARARASSGDKDSAAIRAKTARHGVVQCMKT